MPLPLEPAVFRLRSLPGSAYSYVSTEPVLVRKKQFHCAYVVQEVGLRGVLPGLFAWCSAAMKRLAKPKPKILYSSIYAETGLILFALVTVVMSRHVFAEKGLHGAV